MQVKAKKSLGQNFLKDEKIIEDIFSVAGIQPTDWIFEIGPGTGALTSRLVERVEKIFAIELDHDLVMQLQEQYKNSQALSLFEGNILDMDMKEVLEETTFATHPYKVIANIPYYITAPIIRTLLSLPYLPVSMTLMVQDAVADRLCAKPGEMSLLSLMAQYYARVEKKIFVPKESFDPIPKVDSAVIHIVPEKRYDSEQDRKIFQVARIGFSARRKTLANNLSSGLHIPKEIIEEKLREIGLRDDIRAQALSVENWESLSDILKKESEQ